MLAKEFFSGIKFNPMDRSVGFSTVTLYERGAECGLIVKPVPLGGSMKTKQHLYLVDGGEVDENIPAPHEQKALGVVFYESVKTENPVTALMIHAIAKHAQEKYKARFMCSKMEGAAMVMLLDVKGQTKKLTLAIFDVQAEF